jgi:hypothetical protein
LVGGDFGVFPFILGFPRFPFQPVHFIPQSLILGLGISQVRSQFLYQVQ